MAWFDASTSRSSAEKRLDQEPAPPAGKARGSERSPHWVSVVVVNWNSKDDLEACLQSLRAQTDRHFEVVVVDNGSEDGSVELVREHYREARLLATGKNLGFAEGCNRGIAASTGEWVATLNNDAVADAHWIAELRAAACEGAPDLGMIQSRIVFKQRPDHTNSTGLLVFDDGGAIDRDYDVPLRGDDVPEEVFCPTAGAALYRRRMLEETRLPTGYFDRTFFMYFEDVDLGWRCRLAGWTARYVPSAVVRHAMHGSADRHGQHFVLQQCRKNRIRCVLKNASWRFLLGAAVTNWRDSRQAIWLGGPTMGLQFARAVVDGLRQRRSVRALACVDGAAVEQRWIQPRR
jgi:GT2 family glycosyltransferase